MRVTFLAIALFAPALAGCASPSPDGSDPTDTLGAAFAVACDSRFPDPCVIDAGPNDSPSQTEVELAVNPTDPKNVFVASKDLDPLASDAACVWSVGQVTKDAGATWTTVYVGGTHQERQDPTHPLYGWNCVTDPIFEFDDEGVLYYAMQACCRTLGGERIETPVRASRGTTFAYYLAISRDGGETFPREDIRLLTPETTQAWLHDYPRGAVSPRTGAVMFAWTEFHDFPVVSPPMVSETQYWPFVAVVRDAGRSVATSSIQGPDHPQRNYFFTGLVAGPDGAFHAALV
ncbi:MAG TPA: hypothetical protein VI997_08025, partial [Candidatus Thermoplasmatota archaeon]|nr:hypothetical protein [Candidatus Thermoplasmatota archaeon]